MSFTKALISAILFHSALSLAQANATHYPHSCIQANIPISVVAENNIYDVPKADNNFEATDFVTFIETWSSKAAAYTPTGNITIDDTFSISIQLCTPEKQTERSKILQIATHGWYIDKRYVF